jgi:peptidoglycan/LPS O-acetylase OafA/YrhL
VTTLQQAQPAQARRWNVEALRVGLRDASPARYALYLYLASRVLYLVIAAVAMGVVDIVGAHTALAGAHNWEGITLAHSTLGTEMSNWDGKWYLLTSENWYYHHVIRHAGSYTTLGFMPLYPMIMWVFAHVLGNFGSGLLISMVSGGIATVLIGQLAQEWWGEQSARRAVTFWCFFPGTIVFSMVYSEGVTLALISGAMLLLQRKRWLWAGVCAGFATAVAPAALAAVPMCGVAALVEIYRRGWRDREALRALIAPILAPLGAIGFGIYLWHWTGSPLADYTAQHIEWSESTTLLAVPRVAIQFVHQLFVSGVGTHGPGGVDLNGALALAGTAFLLWGFKLLWEHRSRVPLTAWTWTLCVSVLALTSAKTPPNPRLLIVAFPIVLVVGAALRGRAYNRALRWALFATVLLSPITYVGMWLRP